MLASLLVLLTVLWLLFSFGIGIMMSPTDDMQPKINAGDILLYYRLNRSALEQDVIVFKKNDTEYIGRVIARGGDVLDITDGGNVVVNGNVITENYITSTTPRYEGFVEYPVELKADEYFVLADKRNGGEDSRYFGPVSTSEIKGTLVGLYRRAGF